MGAMIVTAPDFSVTPASLNGNADQLVELAGLLQAGRPDPHLSAWARDPDVPPAIAGAIAGFALFGQDQFQDAVAILSALSGKLEATGANHRVTDDAIEQRANKFLELTVLVPPNQPAR